MARCRHTRTIDLGYTPRVSLMFADVHPLRQWSLPGQACGGLILSTLPFLPSCHSVRRPRTPSLPGCPISHWQRLRTGHSVGLTLGHTLANLHPDSESATDPDTISDPFITIPADLRARVLALSPEEESTSSLITQRSPQSSSPSSSPPPPPVTFDPRCLRPDTVWGHYLRTSGLRHGIPYTPRRP